jgi:pimeloyl-ACP methyl ester carboxylesterase
VGFFIYLKGRRDVLPKAKVNDIELVYRILGEGEPLILIGGYTMVKESWDPLVPALSEHFRVVIFDNRGVGESTVPSEPFTIADMAADTVGLMDELGLDSAHVFGVSMGGLIAQVLALDYSDRVKKAILGCTSHGGRHAVQPAQEVMAILAASADPNIPPEEAVRQKIPILFPERFVRDHPERIEEYIQHSLKHWPTPEGAAGQMKALSVFNVKRRLGEIHCPVLAVTGSEDRMMPPENARLLAEGISGAELRVLEGAGHSFHFQEPEAVCGLLIEFLTQ